MQTRCEENVQLQVVLLELTITLFLLSVLVSCRSVASFWQLCFSSFVLFTINVSGKSD